MSTTDDTSEIKPAYKIIILTDEQKALVMANYATMKLGELVPLVFPGAKPDGRTTEGKSIQSFLAGVGQVAVTIATASTSPNVDLTDTQKQMIDELMRAGRVRTSMEIARLVFPGLAIKNLSKEWRAVYNYMKDIYPDTFSPTEEPVDDLVYQPPDRINTLIGIINAYVPMGGVGRRPYNMNGLKPSEDRQLKALMGYMREYGFKYMASTYDKRVDRDLFISTFIRWTHDKPDLTEIELDQMQQAAAEKVNIAQMEREMAALEQGTA